MPHPEPVSGWSGRIRSASSLAAVLLCTACAVHPSGADPVADLQFLHRATDGGSAEREALWRNAQNAKHTPDDALRIALLQSVPDHSGYDPAAAQQKLRALAQSPIPEIAAVAHTRLDELRSGSQCLGETQELRRRLAQVVEIERRIDAKEQ